MSHRVRILLGAVALCSVGTTSEGQVAVKPPEEPLWGEAQVADELVAAVFACEPPPPPCPSADFVLLVRTGELTGSYPVIPRKRIDFERSNGHRVRVLTLDDKRRLLGTGEKILELVTILRWEGADSVFVEVGGALFSRELEERAKRGWVQTGAGCGGRTFRVRWAGGRWQCAGRATAVLEDAKRGFPYLPASVPQHVEAGVIARADLLALLWAGPDAFRAAHEVAAVTQGGRFVGWRLLRFEPSILSDRLQLGDIVLTINGRQLGQEADLKEIWSTLHAVPELNIQVRRVFTDITYHYVVRD